MLAEVQSQQRISVRRLKSTSIVQPAITFINLASTYTLLPTLTFTDHSPAQINRPHGPHTPLRVTYNTTPTTATLTARIPRPPRATTVPPPHSTQTHIALILIHHVIIRKLHYPLTPSHTQSYTPESCWLNPTPPTQSSHLLHVSYSPHLSFTVPPIASMPSTICSANPSLVCLFRISS